MGTATNEQTTYHTLWLASQCTTQQLSSALASTSCQQQTVSVCHHVPQAVLEGHASGAWYYVLHEEPANNGADKGSEGEVVAQLMITIGELHLHTDGYVSCLQWLYYSILVKGT